MLNLAKKAFTSKKFYKKEYKKVKRKHVILYVLLLAFAYSLFITPIFSYKLNKFTIGVIEKVQEIPQGLIVSYTKENGLETNKVKPIVINFKNTNVVIDAKGSYTNHSLTKTEIVFRNKGVIIYEKGKQQDQQTYKRLGFENFNLKGETVKNTVNKSLASKVTMALAPVIFAWTFILATFNVFFVSFLLGGVVHFLNTQKKTKIPIYNM